MKTTTKPIPWAQNQKTAFQCDCPGCKNSARWYMEIDFGSSRHVARLKLCDVDVVRPVKEILGKCGVG